jgi:hypothetical protein
VQEQGLTFTILLDEDSTAARTYLVRGIPSSFFITREGIIGIKHTGPVDEELVDQYIERVLQ